VRSEVAHKPEDRVKLSIWKIAAYVSLVVGGIVIVCMVVLLLFPDIFINGYFKYRIIKEFTSAYPGYSIRISDLHFNILENRIEFGSVLLNSNDSNFSCSIDRSSLKGIGLLQLIWKGALVPDALANSVAEAQEIVLKIQKSQFEFRCGGLQVSLHDSEIVANDLEIHPLVDDNQFFNESRFRRTRLRMVLPQLKVSGISCIGLLQGKIYHTRFIQIRDVSLDVLVSMYKPFKREASKILMPNEIFTSIKEIIQIDSLSILNGHLKYGESYSARSNPAVVTFDNVQLLAEGISNNNNRGDTLVIHANANLMKEGMMTLLLHVPLTSPKFSLQYSGSVGTMNLNKFSSFLEDTIHVRIKSGIIHSAYFNIKVEDGYAKGYLRVVYEEFILAYLDNRTRSEKGIINRIKSLVANTFKIFGSNKQDKSGLLRLGKVNYSRSRDDTFIRFLWFALRGGVDDVVGF
jgi:hypothetical protein